MPTRTDSSPAPAPPPPGLSSPTLKLPKQEPRPDLTANRVYIAEYDRGTLKLVHDWPVGEYGPKATAARAAGIVAELLGALFPDSAHAGTRPLAEQDLAAIRIDVERRLTP